MRRSKASKYIPHFLYAQRLKGVSHAVPKRPKKGFLKALIHMIFAEYEIKDRDD